MICWKLRGFWSVNVIAFFANEFGVQYVRACFGESVGKGQAVIGVFALLRRFQFSYGRNGDRRRVEHRVARQRIETGRISKIVDRNAGF